MMKNTLLFICLTSLIALSFTKESNPYLNDKSLEKGKDSLITQPRQYNAFTAGQGYGGSTNLASLSQDFGDARLFALGEANSGGGYLAPSEPFTGLHFAQGGSKLELPSLSGLSGSSLSFDQARGLGLGNSLGVSLAANENAGLNFQQSLMTSPQLAGSKTISGGIDLGSNLPLSSNLKPLHSHYYGDLSGEQGNSYQVKSGFMNQGFGLEDANAEQQLYNQEIGYGGYVDADRKTNYNGAGLINRNDYQRDFYLSGPSGHNQQIDYEGLAEAKEFSSSSPYGSGYDSTNSMNYNQPMMSIPKSIIIPSGGNSAFASNYASREPILREAAIYPQSNMKVPSGNIILSSDNSRSANNLAPSEPTYSQQNWASSNPNLMSSEGSSSFGSFTSSSPTFSSPTIYNQQAMVVPSGANLLPSGGSPNFRSGYSSSGSYLSPSEDYSNLNMQEPSTNGLLSNRGVYSSSRPIYVTPNKYNQVRYGPTELYGMNPGSDLGSAYGLNIGQNNYGQSAYGSLESNGAAFTGSYNPSLQNVYQQQIGSHNTAEAFDNSFGQNANLQYQNNRYSGGADSSGFVGNLYNAQNALLEPDSASFLQLPQNLNNVLMAKKSSHQSAYENENKSHSIEQLNANGVNAYLKAENSHESKSKSMSSAENSVKFASYPRQPDLLQYKYRKMTPVV